MLLGLECAAHINDETRFLQTALPKAIRILRTFFFVGQWLAMFLVGYVYSCVYVCISTTRRARTCIQDRIHRTCMYACMHIFVFIYIYICICMHICICVCKYTSMYACMSISAHRYLRPLQRVHSPASHYGESQHGAHTGGNLQDADDEPTSGRYAGRTCPVF